MPGGKILLKLPHAFCLVKTHGLLYQYSYKNHWVSSIMYSKRRQMTVLKTIYSCEFAFYGLLSN